MQTRSSSFGRVFEGLVELVGRAIAAAPAAPSAPAVTLAGRGFPAPVVPDVAVDPLTVPHFRRELFPDAGPVPWLDRPGAMERIEGELAAGRISAADAWLARGWVTDGFVILPRFFSRERLTAVWSAYEAAIAAGTVDPKPEKISDDDPHIGRWLNPHFTIPAVDAMLRDPGMVGVLGMLFGAEPMPFQTIAGHKGSQQHAHSDSIHMTTYPMGYLAANWIAFEDIHPDSGPLVYYPGSHRLPYLLSRELDIPLSAFAENGYALYHERYEPAIAKIIADNGLKPAYFCPGAGDVLVWHANLIHGGSIRNGVVHTRKALVCHYFAEGCLTYHDFTSTPTHVMQKELERRKSL